MSNYFEVGTKDDIFISNSFLSYINPDQGGSPKKALTFFESGIEKKQSISLERGSLLHDWHEHQEMFIVADVVKPEAVMGQWADALYNMLAQSEGGYNNVTDDFIIEAKGSFYGNVKDRDKSLSKFKESGADKYVEFLFKANGKVAMTVETKRIVESQIAALTNHKKANHMLFGATSDGQKRLKELEIYWTAAIEGFPDKFLKFKAKLDNIIIDFNKKVIYLNDLKSTGKPVSLFKQAFINYRYYRQIAFYTTALFQYLLQEGFNPSQWQVIPRMVAVDNTKEFNVHSFTIDNKWIEVGNKEVNDLVGRVLWHTVNEEWSYTPEEVENKYDCHLDFSAKDELFNGGENGEGL